MHSHSEFAKILESQLRKERNSSQTSASTKKTPQEPPSEAWTYLMGNLSTWTFTQSFQSSQYKKFQTPPKVRPANKLSQDQLTAFLFFAAHGAKLEANFSIKDLKKAFRNLALKMHPDHGSNTQTFLELKAAHDLLINVFKKA